MDPSKDPGVMVAQIFMEKATFSHRPDFLGLPPEAKPEVGNVSVNVQAGESPDGESGLIRIEVKTDPEKKPTYNVELAVVAFVTRVPDNKNLTIREFMMSGAGVSLVYPFVREAFANLTLRGRFGPVWLNLINPRPIAEGLRAQAEALAKRATPSEPPRGESAGRPTAEVGSPATRRGRARAR